jgi:hypothetical protein
MRFRIWDNEGMAQEQGLIRELRPHATWRGIELLWDLVRAALMAALIALWQWFVNHWDVVTIALVFIACLGLLIWRDISNAKSTSEGARPPDDLARSLSDPLPSTTAANVLTTAPRLRVDYVNSGQKGALVFKSDKPSTVRSINPLLVRERFEAGYNFSCIPAPPFSVDVNSSVECKMYGLSQQNAPDIHSLADVLRGGSQQSLDSVVIDYDDDHGNAFSRRFDLSRGQDDSIAWIPSPSVDFRGQTRIPDPDWQNLGELRYKLLLASKYHDEHSAAQQYARQLDEEKRRNENEVLKNKVAKLISPEDKLIATFTEVEYKLFAAMRSDFAALPWCQKIALKRISGVGVAVSSDFQRELSATLGFADPEKIVGQLQRRGFLEDTPDGTLKLPAGKAKWIEVLLETQALC